ncbi:MAG: peptidoglycan DD-metalloendopeptidase family protein [Lewinella sp.]|nr:peptidoglycan DD-metalloendopeptidase family protein [Lewinella sp.]
MLLLLATGLSGQSSAEALRQRRQQLLREIEANNDRLATTQRDKAATVGQITLLQRQINNREELITNLQTEVEFLDNGIRRTTEVIGDLEADVKRLQVEYAELVRAAYRARLQRSWLTFLLSSSSFNEAFRRWQYLRQYQRFRLRQAELVVATQATLRTKLGQLENNRTEKADLLTSQQEQRTALNRERGTQQRMLTRLKSSESELLAEIREQEKAREELNQAIERAITAEMDRVRRAERGEVASSTTATAANEPAGNVTASNFGSQRGQLPWPVSGGRISRHFGRQPHPTVPNVEISNNGIDIALEGATAVKAVAGGTVVSTAFVPGYRHMVLLRHGVYYTVYSNLETVAVRTGEEIAAGHTLGQTSADANEMHFELWRQKERLNPEQWIRRR